MKSDPYKKIKLLIFVLTALGCIGVFLVEPGNIGLLVLILVLNFLFVYFATRAVKKNKNENTSKDYLLLILSALLVSLIIFGAPFLFRNPSNKIWWFIFPALSYTVPFYLWKKFSLKNNKNYPLVYFFISGSVLLGEEILGLLSGTEMFSPNKRYENWPISWVLNTIGIVIMVVIWFFIDKQIRKLFQIKYRFNKSANS